MPRAMSRPREPVDTDSTSKLAAPSPRRITEPLPNCFSIWPNAAASAFLRFSSIFRHLGRLHGEGNSLPQNYPTKRWRQKPINQGVSLLFSAFLPLHSAYDST